MAKEMELLAPAGSLEILKGVISAGANAVYLGGAKFGARAYANNFSEEEMLFALDYAHLHKVKIYLTVNTLLKNQEIGKELYDYLLPFYQAGLDAVLVQDMGVLDFIRNYFPDLPIHASTQMTVTSKESALYLKELGVSRVVVSRELSLDEMKEIYQATGLELEAFVHGALCYSYSGACLFSSMLGGRSGNRGRCAQPCRLGYSVFESDKKIKKESYILSLKDLCGINDLSRLRDAGVCSLKIEGRMKQLTYAYGVTAVYRNALDRGEIDRERLLELGNRGGFTNCYYSRHNSESMITYEDSSLHNAQLPATAIPEQKLYVNGSAILKEGQPACMKVTRKDHDRSFSFEATGSLVESAQKSPLKEADVRERLQKTGGTEFSFDAFDLTMDPAVFLPNGALNALRREALEGLKEGLLANYRRKGQKPYPADSSSSECFEDPEASDRGITYIAALSMRSQLRAALSSNKITALYLDLAMYDHDFTGLEEDITLCQKSGKKLYLLMPQILRNKDITAFEDKQSFLNHLPIEGFVFGSLDTFALCKRLFPGHELIGDHSLYTYNDYAVRHYLKQGVQRLCAPLELNRGELGHRDNRFSEILVYGRYPLMQTANCVCRDTKGCSHKMQRLILRDRKNADFPVLNHCNYCYNTIYNSVATSLLTEKESLRNMGFRYMRLHFTDESAEEIHTILRCIEDDNLYNQEKGFTYGHFKRGVE